MKTKALTGLMALLVSSTGFAEGKSLEGDRFPRYPAAYYTGAALAAGGLAFGFIAQGQSKRADNLTGAVDAARALNSAKSASAMSNMFYGLAGLTVAYGLVLELLPREVAERAALTFHF